MSYALFESLVLALLLPFSLWLALRRAAPKLALQLGALARRAGLPDALASRLFGHPAACASGCGSCGGCEKPAAAHSPLHFQRKP